MQQQERKTLPTQQILEYFLQENSDTERQILGSRNLITTDHSLYEALGSIYESDGFNWRKIVKFLEAVKVVSFENVTQRKKPILTQKRVEELRKNLHKEA